jgi:hypothetical protein
LILIKTVSGDGAKKGYRAKRDLEDLADRFETVNEETRAEIRAPPYSSAAGSLQRSGKAAKSTIAA